MIVRGIEIPLHLQHLPRKKFTRIVVYVWKNCVMKHLLLFLASRTKRGNIAKAIKALYFEGNTKEAEVGNVSNIDKTYKIVKHIAMCL